MAGIICTLRESDYSISFVSIGQFENIDYWYWFISLDVLNIERAAFIIAIAARQYEVSGSQASL